MAWRVRATYSRNVPRKVARTSRAMTIEARVAMTIEAKVKH